MKRECPEAWLHVTSNPLSRLLHGLIHYGGFERVVGHCHGTHDVRRQFAQLFQKTWTDIDVRVAGINHFHIVQRALHVPTRKDLLKRLKSVPADRIVELRKNHHTLWEQWCELGYYFGPGYFHTFDYLPCASARHFHFAVGSLWYEIQLQEQSANRPPAGVRIQTEEGMKEFLDGDFSDDIFAISQALSGRTGSYPWFSANLPNDGHIPQVPQGAIVELPGRIFKGRLRMDKPQAPLPEFFLSWMNTHLTIHRLSVEATVRKSRRAAIEAIAADPAFRGCQCRPDVLLADMLEANGNAVPALR